MAERIYYASCDGVVIILIDRTYDHGYAPLAIWCVDGRELYWHASVEHEHELRQAARQLWEWFGHPHGVGARIVALAKARLR